MNFYWRSQKLRKTKKKQNKKQNLMTHQTLEEKTKIKDQLLPQTTLKLILKKIHKVKGTFPKKHVQRITTLQRKRSVETKIRKINILTNKPKIPLGEVILCNGCHWLSPLDITSLDNNVNNNEKYQFQRH